MFWNLYYILNRRGRLIMCISVNRIISCQDLLDLKPDEFNPCSVIISDGLPIDIVLDSEIYIHEAYDYIVVGDKEEFINHIFENKLKKYCHDKIIRERHITPIIKQLEKIIRTIPYEYIQGNEENLERLNYDDTHMLLYELKISMDKYQALTFEADYEDEDYSPNWDSDTIYSRAGYTVRHGERASKRLSILFKLSDLYGRNLRWDFERYCWFIEKYRSNSKAVYANKRRRRDLEALRYYESHDGLIKYTEDFGNNID